MKLNKIKKQIPSLRVSKNLLIELCGILEKEYQSKKPEKEPAIYGLTYKFSNSDVSIQENKSKLFVENVPETIGDIKLSLELEEASIEVTIEDTRYYDWNTFSISGEDSTWVFGMAKRLEQIFEKYKTMNHIFHTKKGYSVYALCSFGLFLLTFVGVINSGYQPEESSIEISAGLIGGNVFFMTLLFLWPPMFKRAFPILEKKDSRQATIKRMLPLFATGIISSIVAGFILLLIS